MLGSGPFVRLIQQTCSVVPQRKERGLLATTLRLGLFIPVDGILTGNWRWSFAFDLQRGTTLSTSRKKQDLAETSLVPWDVSRTRSFMDVITHPAWWCTLIDNQSQRAFTIQRHPLMAPTNQPHYSGALLLPALVWTDTGNFRHSKSNLHTILAG